MTERRRPSRSSRGSNRQPPEIEIDISAAHPARVHNYLSGGDAHFAVDREAIEQATAVLPGGLEAGRYAVRSIAEFHGRAIRHLVAEAGIRQFLKLGTAVPSGDDVHEVAQAAAPDTRVVYVGDDPTVLAHAHSVREQGARGTTAYVHGSLRDVEAIVEEAAATLDLRRPVALLLPVTLNFVPTEHDPYGIVADFVASVAAGSHLVLSHIVGQTGSERDTEAAERFSKLLGESFVVRSRQEIARFFEGLELVEPGLAPIDRWWPPTGPPPDDAASGPPAGRPAPIYAGVGRKP